MLRQVLEAYFRVLDGVTLADLVAQQQAKEVGGKSGHWGNRVVFRLAGWISPISWLSLSPLILVW